MALKDILVHLQPDPRSDVRLKIAADLAHRCGAYLTGLFVVDIPSTNYLYGAGLSMAGMAPDQTINVLIADARAAAAPVEASLRRILHARGLQGEWCFAEGHIPTAVSTRARCADVVVVGQPNESRREYSHDRLTVETVMMTCGRPVLTIPFAGDFPVLTDHVLVAWNGSREAARAVHDALPLLQAAGKVTLLAVQSRAPAAEDVGAPNADLVMHLARHGVRTETMRTLAQNISDGEALLSYAADISASMIVAGGYGHSRARELIFGGVTRTLLAEMTVPVLFSH